MFTLDAALLPPLLDLESQSPAELAALFASAINLQTASPAAGAANQVFRQAALTDLEPQQLETRLRAAGVGPVCAAAAAQCWATHGIDHRRTLVADAVTVRKVIDVDWTFGGGSCPLCQPRLMSVRPTQKLTRLTTSRAVSASSSEHAAVGQTYVQLRLVVDGAGKQEYVHMGARCHPLSAPRPTRRDCAASSHRCSLPPSPLERRNATTEMNLPRFYEFLHELECARAKLDLMS